MPDTLLRRGPLPANLRFDLQFAISYLRRHGDLIARLTVREIQARYRGSWLGPLWSLLTPLLLLSVYTFVFSVVFRARWGAAEQSRMDFILNAFGNMTVFGIFAETIGGAPGLILANSNYVKRVVFPLEILPVTRLLSSLINAGIGLLVFLMAAAVTQGGLAWTVVLLPLTLLPLALGSLGLAFILSALGVFVRDIGNLVGLMITMLMFLSPVFFPLSNLPPRWQSVLRLNPMATILDDFRLVTLAGELPPVMPWLLVTLLSMLLATAGLALFIKCKRGFADVI